MTKMLHYQKELNALSRLFLDIYLKTATLLVASEFTKEVQGFCGLKLMTIKNCATAIAE